MLILLAFLCVACHPSYISEMVEADQELEYVLRANLEDPDALLAALDAYIDKYQPLWDKNAEHLKLEGKDLERVDAKYDREINVVGARVREIFLNIVDLDLEIQDRLQNDPQKLRDYQARIMKIGVPQSQNSER